MKNIKTFETESEYQSYITGSTAVLPNLSYVKGTDEVHTTQAPSITVTINVYETSEPTRVISSGLDDIKTIIIDGVKQETIQTGYTFSSTGEHTVKYLFKENVNGIPESMFDGESGGIVDVAKVKMSNGIKEIGNYAFYGCQELIDIEIKEDITSIGTGACQDCGGLTSVTIPNGVTSIGQEAFAGCDDLNSIVSLATTAPTISLNTFQSIKTNGTLYVPQGSTGYDVWMGTGDFYLGKYSWTKVEQ